MFPIILFIFISFVNTQYYSVQQQSPLHNPNSWSHYPTWNQLIKQSRPMTRENSMYGYICLLRPDPGTCFATFQQYYFNPQLHLCQTFIWSGCGGNQNRFSTRFDCERTCSNHRRRIHHNVKHIPMG